MHFKRGLVADGPMEGRVVASLDVNMGFGHCKGEGHPTTRYGWRPKPEDEELVGLDDDGQEVPCDGTWHVV